jgi:peptide chain release factor 2
VVFDLPSIKHRLQQIDTLTSDDEFWSDTKRAKEIFAQKSLLQERLNTITSLEEQFNSFNELLSFVGGENSSELMEELEEELAKLTKQFFEFEIATLLNGQYDNNDVILEIHPGAGGTESQDWADMLFRMYSRYCELKHYKVDVVDMQLGEDAGIKTVTMLIKGKNAYGLLKKEAGIHRLVRISPFDANKRRHTSFASVDVIPQIGDIDLVIDEKDLRIDTYRASGAGGQHINKTDSAVRITHIPTNIVAASQSERSQILNKQKAMEVLKSRLQKNQIAKQEEVLSDLRGEKKSIEWGSQIRSYVFCPYQLVKDHRYDYETSDIERIMNGDLDELLYNNLQKGIISD